MLDQAEVISCWLPSIVAGESKTNLQSSPKAKVLGNHKYLHVHLITAAGKWSDKVKLNWTAKAPMGLEWVARPVRKKNTGRQSARLEKPWFSGL